MTRGLNESQAMHPFVRLRYLAGAVMISLGPAMLWAAPVLSVGSTAGVPGGTVPVAVSYTTDTNAPSLQFDLLYATNYLASGPPAGGSALADHLVATSEPTNGVRRVVIFSFSNTPITNGVLVFVPFTITTNAPDHDAALVLSNGAGGQPERHGGAVEFEQRRAGDHPAAALHVDRPYERRSGASATGRQRGAPLCDLGGDEPRPGSVDCVKHQRGASRPGGLR
jgi:hypothetical protein